MITVLGAAGKTGRVVAERLLASGRRVRVVGRDAKKLKALVMRGAEPAVGDLLDAEFLTRVFRDVDAAYALAPPDLSQPDPRAFYNRCGEAIRAAMKGAGLRRLVFLSSLGAELAEGTGPIQGLHDIERMLEESGADVILLRPGYFYENHLDTLGLIKSRGVNGGLIDPDVPLPMTATRDIGTAAARLLASADVRGVTVRELLGPRDYTMAEATRILGTSIGKPDLTYVRLSERDFTEALVAMGASSGAAESLVEMSHALSAGKIVPRAPRSAATTMPTSLEDFAPAFTAAYRAL